MGWSFVGGLFTFPQKYERNVSEKVLLIKLYFGGAPVLPLFGNIVHSCFCFYDYEVRIIRFRARPLQATPSSVSIRQLHLCMLHLGKSFCCKC